MIRIVFGDQKFACSRVLFFIENLHFLGRTFFAKKHFRKMPFKRPVLNVARATFLRFPSKNATLGRLSDAVSKFQKAIGKPQKAIDSTQKATKKNRVRRLFESRPASARRRSVNCISASNAPHYINRISQV
jgi:hypothetical protein